MSRLTPPSESSAPCWTNRLLGHLLCRQHAKRDPLADGFPALRGKGASVLAHGVFDVIGAATCPRSALRGSFLDGLEMLVASSKRERDGIHVADRQHRRAARRNPRLAQPNRPHPTTDPSADRCLLPGHPRRSADARTASRPRADSHSAISAPAIATRRACARAPEHRLRRARSAVVVAASRRYPRGSQTP